MNSSMITTPSAPALLQKIGWLCHSLRFLAVGYCAWQLYALALFWNNEALVISHYRTLSVDVSGVTATERWSAFAVGFAVWLVLVAACWNGWRMFSTFLEGRIFSVDASIYLRRLGVLGAVAQIVDVLARPLYSIILTAHMPAGRHIVSVYFRPEDLSTLMLLATLIALAHIQKTAVEIADENAQIV